VNTTGALDGKGRTQRTVFLGVDTRLALADYLDHERPADADPDWVVGLGGDGVEATMNPEGAPETPPADRRHRRWSSSTCPSWVLGWRYFSGQDKIN